MGTITHSTVVIGVNDPTKQVSKNAWNAGHTISLDKTDVGLSNVDNTSDANKPISTATQTALDLKLPISGGTSLVLSQGLVVGYAGVPSADTIQLGDDNFGLDFGSGVIPFVEFDVSDALSYARGTNTYNFLVASAPVFIVANGSITPGTDGTSSLGTASIGWQNLHGNTGFTLNIENGNWLATHTSGVLTVGTGDLRVTTAGTNAASVVTVGGAQTLTGKTLTSPTLTTPALGTPASGNLSNCTADGTSPVGFRNIPQNSQSAAYTTVLADAGKHIYHPSADTTARIWTIPANASVAYPIGTAITFVNDTSGGVITIAITSDTLVLAGAGTTGSRSLAANGVATAIKMTATRWIISGTGLT